MNVRRFLRTISYLRPEQIYGRVAYQFARPKPRLGNTPSRRSVVGVWNLPVERAVSLLGPQQVRFLNKDGAIAFAAQWNDPTCEKLWLYNLHYFDDLNAMDAQRRADWHRALIQRWIVENPPGSGNGWEPYPVSLRIVNWIKWALRGNVLDPDWLDSLAVQARWLESRLEWHLLGNHLLANAKALLFAGLFFEGAEAERWLGRARKIYCRELPEQILSDGGHFERSPMYHAIILEDLLDGVNATRAFGISPDSICPGWIERITAMRDWLSAMTLGDGRIAFFNDAAFGIAAEPDSLDAYATRLALPATTSTNARVIQLPQSGYVRFAMGQAIVLCDVAPIGPDYLPGHAHADTLSFEFSLGSERVIVNGGTSVYGRGPQRSSERSTRAHSTVEIDGVDSSEVWDGFRVGRRARVREVKLEVLPAGVQLTGAHDGYMHRRGRPMHIRTWRLFGGMLTLTDEIAGRHGSAVVHYHLGPGVEARAEPGGLSGEIRLQTGRPIIWRSSSPARIAHSFWRCEFGRQVPISQIVADIPANRFEVEFNW